MIKKYTFNKSDVKKYFYKILFEPLMYIVLFFLGYLYYKKINDSSLINMMIIGVFIVWSILYLFPLLLLYFNHRFYSKSIILIYDETGNSLTYRSPKKNIAFTTDDIEKVELYLTPNAYKKFIDWQYFGKYHYSKIITNNGEIINISCLVCDEIEDIIPEKLIEKKKKYIPIVE